VIPGTGAKSRDGKKLPGKFFPSGIFLPSAERRNPTPETVFVSVSSVFVAIRLFPSLPSLLARDVVPLLTMNIMLGNNVRLPLRAKPWIGSPIPVDFSEMPVQTISLTPPASLNGLATPKAASPPPRSLAEQALQEPFDQFDDLFTPLGSTALSDWPL
jgi:hypothetical protein